MLACAAVLPLLAPASAFAFGGLEIAPGGARALGRGGATTARAEDAYVLLHNPAGLAALQSDQLMLNIDAPFHDMCVTPYGYYGWGVSEAGASDFGNSGAVTKLDDNGKPIVGAQYASDPLDEVCNSAPVRPLPALAYTLKLGEDLGLGFGFVSPAGLPALQYGGANGSIETPDGPRPTPTRYQLVKQAVTFALGPTVGIGYRVLPRVRVGLAFTWIAVANEVQVVQAAGASTSPHNDLLAKIKAHDYFIPSVTLGVLATPFDSVDVGLAARVVDDFNGSGDVRYTTNTYRTLSKSGYRSYVNDPIPLTKVKTSLPWLVTAGVRYASALPNAPRAADGTPLRGDPLAQEQFDIELDGAFQMNARTSSTHVSFGEGEIVSRMIDGTSDAPIEVPDPEMNDFSADKHAEDAASVRLGGTYNLWPGAFGVSAGTFYESRAVDAAYANIDSFAFARVGLGLGVIARLGSWDLAAAYGHVFQETLVVAPPRHQVRQRATDDPTTGFDKRIGAPADDTGGHVLQEQNPPKASEVDATARLEQSAVYKFKGTHARVVNAGVYSASFNVVSVNATCRF